MAEENSRPEVLQQRILDVTGHPDHRGLRRRDVAGLFDIPGGDTEGRAALAEALARCVASGALLLTQRGKYVRPTAVRIEGVYTSTPRGFGFVQSDSRAEDLFIPEENAGGALNGDTVLAVVTEPGRDGRRDVGKVVKVVSRALTKVVGTYRRSAKSGIVIPDNPRILADFSVRPEDCPEAQNNDKVELEITRPGDGSRRPDGFIRRVIGHAGAPGVDIESVAASYELPEVFPDAVLRELEEIPDAVRVEDLEGRTDLRSVPTVTIDGEDSRDFDDAVSLSREGNLWHLGVHIADVSHYVREGSALDEEAMKRGTSVYFPDRVIPMLPEKLSVGICSLNEGVDRLALSCLMDVDRTGEVTAHRLELTVIRSDHRMTYPKVAEILDRPEGDAAAEYADVCAMFQDMRELSVILRKKRQARGAISFDFPESKITLDAAGRPVDIRPYPRNAATDLIEDFMLLANETVAEDYFWMDAPFLYRVHEKPDSDKMKQLAVFLGGLGYTLHGARDIHPRELQQVLERAEGTEEEPLLARMLLRAMKQARYSTENTGHFGLSARYYCHFTSPIRRYPDLWVHRIIHENLAGRLTDAEENRLREKLPGVAEQSSAAERRAQNAERTVEKMKKAQYMRQRIGKEYDGIISGVTGSGIYVALSNTVEGMIPVSYLVDDYYVFSPERLELAGRSFGHVYRLGQTVHVMVTDADPVLNAVTFRIVNPTSGTKKHWKDPDHRDLYDY